MESCTMDDAQLSVSSVFFCSDVPILRSFTAGQLHSCAGHTPHRTGLPGVTGLVVCVKAPLPPPEVVHAPPRKGSRDF